MGETRHRTVIEVAADTQSAEAAVGRLQSMLERANNTAARILGGGGGGGPGPPGTRPGPAPAPPAPGPTLPAAAGGGPSSAPAPPPPLAGAGGVGAPPPPLSGGGGGSSFGGGGGGGGGGDARFMASSRRAGGGGVGRAMAGAAGGAALAGTLGASAAMPIMAMGGGLAGGARAIATRGRESARRTAFESARASGASVADAAATAASAAEASPVGAVAGPIAHAMAGLTALTAAGVTQRFGRAQQMAGMDASLVGYRNVGMSGDIGGAAAAGAPFGYQPGESASMLGSFGNAAGFDMSSGSVNSPGRSDIFRAARAGVGPGALGRFAGLQAPGAGGKGGDAMGMLSQGFAEGLRNSRLAEWLQIIAGHTENMAQQGVEVNLDDMQSFIGKLRAQGGDGEKAGMYMPRFAAKLGGAKASARSKLLGGFGGLPEAAAMASAMNKGGSIADVAERLESMKPAEIQRQMRSMFGEDVTALAFAQGMPMRFAKRFAGELPEVGAPGENVSASGAPIAAAAAGVEAGLLRGLNSKQAIALIKNVGAIRGVLDKFGGLGGGLLTTLRTIKTTLEGF